MRTGCILSITIYTIKSLRRAPITSIIIIIIIDNKHIVIIIIIIIISITTWVPSGVRRVPAALRRRRLLRGPDEYSLAYYAIL